jgi:phosphotriesterase-related protein
MAEVASKTGFNIIFATGLYHQHLGGAPYWLFRQHLEPDVETRLAKLFITELTEGVASTGVKAGVIKVATFKPPFTDYEKMVFRAAATASIATGAPITTHTEAILGEEQVKFLTALGVPAHKIIIGHSCGTSDNSYHTAILKTGAYIGFDRFGLERLRSDEDRVESLATLIGQGYSSRLILSHDCVWCWRGLSGPAPTRTDAATDDGSMRLTRVITPLLLNRGITQGQIDSILIDNPRRYFAGT